MDEAGQTGENLLDSMQPIFALASVDLDEGEALELLGTWRGEAHFVTAKRSRIGRARVVRLLDTLPKHRVKVVAVHKPFMVTAKIIDELYEPILHTSGIDAYADGSLIALANVWHFTCDPCVGPGVLPDLHRLFVDAIRERSREAMEAFYACIGDAVVNARCEVPAMREIWLNSAERFAELLEQQQLPLLEPGVPAAQALVYEWAKAHPDGFEVRHDRRNQLDDWIAHLSTFYDQNKPPAEFTFPNGVTIRLPVPVASFESADSDQHPSIQVADIVASAVSFVLRPQKPGTAAEQFAAELTATPMLDFVASELSIWPNQDLLRSPPTRAPRGEFDRLTMWLHGQQ